MTGKKGIRFKGHETFTLREGWLNKGLTAVEADPKVFSENFGADALGVGPNMAKAIRYWLKCAGLTEEIKKGVRLTDIGKLILEKDPYIEDNFTLWLVHCRIVSNREQATAWNLFFNEFSYEEFDKSQLAREMKELAARAAKEVLALKNPAEKSVEDDCDAILHMYVKKGDKGGTPEDKNVSPFGKLELIKIIDGKYCRKQPDLNRLPEDIVLCLLTECLKDRTSVNIDDLLTIPNGPGRLLHLKRNALIEMLEKLEKTDKIVINRTAGLNMLYVTAQTTTDEIAEKYYRG